MPEAASPAQTFMPVKPGNESVRNLNSDDAPYSVRSGKDNSAINGGNSSIPKKSADKTGHGPDDFDTVLSRKIDGQKEQTPDEHPQKDEALVETDELNLTWHMSCSGPVQGNSPLENTDGQVTSEQAVAEISNPLRNTGDIQGVKNTVIMGETMNPENQMKDQPFDQTRGTTIQSAVPRDEPVAVTTNAEAELPVGEKQAQAPQTAVMKNPDVSGNNVTESEQFQVHRTTEQMPKQLSDESDLEIRPVRTDQDKSVLPDIQAVIRSARPEQQQGLRSQSNHSGAGDQFKGEDQDVKNPQGIPLEAETSIDDPGGMVKGFEVRNVQSMLHSAEPSENASISALEAPARTGVHGSPQPNETIKPVDQILQHLNSVSVSDSQRRIQLTLTPEHLGTLRITFNQTEGEIVGLLEVQKNQTRRDIEQSLPELVSAMQSNGVQVRRIEVVQWNAGQDSVEDGPAKESGYSAADRFYDESSSDSSESEAFESARFDRHDQKSSQLSQTADPNNPGYNTGVNETGLNMFI